MRPSNFAGIAAGLLVLVGAAVAALLWQEQVRVEERAIALTQGDPARGEQRIVALGCGGCHDIPGVTGAHGLTGPALSKSASRVYLAGRLPNTPENLMRWIQDPHAVDPQTAMPNVGANADDARNIAAYLYTMD
jgi:cytochrome c1